MQLRSIEEGFPEGLRRWGMHEFVEPQVRRLGELVHAIGRVRFLPSLPTSAVGLVGVP